MNHLFALLFSLHHKLMILWHFPPSVCCPFLEPGLVAVPRVNPHQSPLTGHCTLYRMLLSWLAGSGSHFPNVNFSNYLKRIFILLILNHCCLFDVLWRGMVLCNQTLRVMAGVICESVWWAEGGVRFPGTQISSLMLGKNCWVKNKEIVLFHSG